MGTASTTRPEAFSRSEHLKNKKRIEELFAKGRQVRFFPLLLYYIKNQQSESPVHQVLFSVPKKHFKKATVRNKIRRKIREAYRRNKVLLYNKYMDLPFLLGYVYISKTDPTYSEIEAGMIASLNYLAELKKA